MINEYLFKQEIKQISNQLENDLPKELSRLNTSLEETDKALQREEQAVKEGRRKVEEAHLLKQQVRANIFLPKILEK